MRAENSRRRPANPFGKTRLASSKTALANEILPVRPFCWRRDTPEKQNRSASATRKDLNNVRRSASNRVRNERPVKIAFMQNYAILLFITA